MFFLFGGGAHQVGDSGHQGTPGEPSRPGGPDVGTDRRDAAGSGRPACPPASPAARSACLLPSPSRGQFEVVRNLKVGDSPAGGTPSPVAGLTAEPSCPQRAFTIGSACMPLVQTGRVEQFKPHPPSGAVRVCRGALCRARPSIVSPGTQTSERPHPHLRPRQQGSASR